MAYFETSSYQAVAPMKRKGLFLLFYQHQEKRHGEHYMRADDCSWLAKRMCFQVLMKNMSKPLLDKSTWHSKKMLINYNFLRNVIWSLYFYFSFFVFIFQIIQVLFPVKIDLSPSSSSSSYVCNLKSHNLTSRKHLINHLVKYPHEETEAQRG